MRAYRSSMTGRGDSNDLDASSAVAVGLDRTGLYAGTAAADHRGTGRLAGRRGAAFRLVGRRLRRRRRAVRCAGAAAEPGAAAPRTDFAPAAGGVSQHPAADVGHRTHRARSGHRLVGRRTVPRASRLAETARLPGTSTERRRTVLPRQRGRRAVPPVRRLAHFARAEGPAPRDLAVHQGQGLPRPHHPEEIRRQGILRLGAFADRDQAVDALLRFRGDGDGAELARPCRTAAALRHRRAEGSLSAASGQGAGNSVLRADQSAGGVGCGVDPRLRHRLPRYARGPRSARHACDLGQALHHPGSGRHTARPGLPPVRPRPPARRHRRHRHHLRADSDRPSGRADRSPPLPPERRVPERPELGARRVHASGVDHRRPGDGRPGLAHADGVPGRRPLDLAARLQHRHGQAHRACGRRLCPRAQPVQDGDRPLRRHTGTAGPHRRPPLHDGRRAADDRVRHRPRREAVGGVGHRQVPHHRTRPHRRQ